MRRKGASIFQKLFTAFLCIALITLIISGVVHYNSKKKFIERTITSQISDNLHASIDYFNKTFIIPIKKDLGFIEVSPALNNFLTSQKNETLLTKPPVERLFLYFTRRADSIYLSSRFIDSKGKEKIIASGNRRVRDYVTIDQFPDNMLYQRIYSLFKRLKAEKLGSILFEGPFNYENKATFVIGSSKIEPEIGGFGGVVIFHCDLTGYLHYLSDIKFNQSPIAFLFSPDHQVMLSPEKETSPHPGLNSFQEKNTNNALAVSSSVKLGSNNNVLVNLVLSIPPKIFFSELKKALIDSALIGMSIILLVGFVAFFISMKLFAKPIKKLSYGTKRIGSGDLNYRIKIETHDEIAQLADEFNRMAESLQKTTVSRDMLINEVNERKRIDKALREHTEALERSNRELEQFAYVASHDLQEPLRMVASYTQLLAKRYKGRLDSDADEFIAYAVDGATRMQVLINDLLAYSRVGTRGKNFEPTACETILEKTLDNLQKVIEDSEAKVTHDLLPTVMGDDIQLGQLFQNLITNAIKFQGDEVPQIHISAVPNEDKWIFSVQDNGIGIDPEYNERIFVIFQRLYGREEYPGTGIGLAICKKIVERHGGNIWVESEPEKGSRFYFTIPMKGESLS